jgi:hypothetical protein
MLVRITVFNTFYACSRKWYDFEMRPADDLGNSTSLRSGRALAVDEPGVFDVNMGLKKTMIEEVVPEVDRRSTSIW